MASSESISKGLFLESGVPGEGTHSSILESEAIMEDSSRHELRMRQLGLVATFKPLNALIYRKM